jgi:hypothetical protein
MRKTKMKMAQYGTTIIVIHEIINGLHGLAHTAIPIPLSLLQSWFVGTVIFPAPIITAILLWTYFYRIGYWLLLGSMAGSGLFGIYNHFIVISPDHVSHVAFVGWGWLFQVTAGIIPIVNGIGCGIAIWALRTISQPKQA